MKLFLLALTALLLGSLTFAQTLTVFAASSLTESFEEIASDFEVQNEGVDVLLSFEGSSTLATQITQGAPADVFASADEDQMQVVVEAGLTASDPQIFAGNRLVVITTENSSVKILFPNQAASLAKRETRVVARGLWSNQAARRVILTAAAMASCWKWVLGRPK